MKAIFHQRIDLEEGCAARRISVLFLVLLAVATAPGQDPAHPLKPPDRSSPRAALKTFLEAGDGVGAFIATNYVPSPSRAKFHQAVALAETLVQGLDLSAVPPAARVKTARAAAGSLYVTLSRIQLPAFEDIPDASQLAQPTGTNAARWVIPNTEIALERAQGGPRSGEFLFSADTVAKANRFHEKVRGLPYVRKVPLENMKELMVSGGGWMIPHGWLKALPQWLHFPLADQAAWKWVGLILIVGLFALCLRGTWRLSRRGSPERPFLHALAQSALPAFFLVATPMVAYLALVQVNIVGGVANVIELLTTAILFLAGAWISWRLALVVAEAIIASPNIAPESIDAHLIRICTRLLGIVGAATLLAMGADRMGMPVYGIVAGLGVGGLAIALAAQPTIENLIGGLNLFADRPIRVGDACRCGSEEGKVEAIGIRSTRIRGVDRSVTAIPNAVLSKMSIVNLTQRDRILMKAVIGVRYETSPEQLRYLLAKIRELLLGHPRIQPDSARARFIGFGASSLDIEVYAYVMTKDPAEFLGIREDVWLRVMDIVKQSGTDFAFPSQTVYFSRDGGLDPSRIEAVEAQVRQWREEGRLPFPDFSPEQVQGMRGALVYPPPGSPDQSLPAEGAPEPGGRNKR